MQNSLQKPQPEQARQIKIALTKEQLGVALLSFVERTSGVTIPCNDVSYEIYCFTGEDGQVEKVEALFKAVTPKTGVILP